MGSGCRVMAVDLFKAGSFPYLTGTRHRAQPSLALEDASDDQDDSHYILNKEDKRQLRSILFRHLDGIGTAPTMFALHQQGVLAHLLETEEVSLADLSQKFKANEGYLNVALRILCSQGWLEQEVNNADDVIVFRITPLSKIAFELAPLYADVVDLIKFSEGFHHRKFEIEPFRKLERIFEKI